MVAHIEDSGLNRLKGRAIRSQARAVVMTARMGPSGCAQEREQAEGARLSRCGRTRAESARNAALVQIWCTEHLLNIVPAQVPLRSG